LNPKKAQNKKGPKEKKMRKLLSVFPAILMILFFLALMLFLFRVPIEKARIFQKISYVIESLPAPANANTRPQSYPQPAPPPFPLVLKSDTIPPTTKVATADSLAKKDTTHAVKLSGKVIISRKTAKKRNMTDKPSGKKLTVGMVKWLVNHKWGRPIERNMYEFRLPDSLYNAISSVPVHEAGANPKAKNDSSTAKGLYQMLDGTFKQMASELAKECDSCIDPGMVNPENADENIMLGVYLFKKNWIASNGNLKLTILYHYTGSEGHAAQDTINAHGGKIDNVPFLQCVMGVMNTPEEKPPEWAVKRWRSF
jgi:muramidase (phage lysozyme)